jgi:hypothetical protein
MCHDVARGLSIIRFVTLCMNTTEEDLLQIIEKPETQRWIRSFIEIPVSKRFQIWMCPKRTKMPEGWWSKEQAEWVRTDVQGKLESCLTPWSLKSGLLMYDEDDLGFGLLFADDE